MLIGMMILAVLLLIAVLVVTSQDGIVPWIDDLERHNAGVARRAEWLAPSSIAEQVKHDYLAFYDFAAEALADNWVRYLHGMEEYLAGEMLHEQRDSLRLRLQHDRGRVTGILRANHSLSVRNFSADGLQCMLIDVVSDQRMATYDYWGGERLHTQDLGDAVCVYQMVYSQHYRRWRIAKHVQSMYRGSCQPSEIDITLPPPVGRDQ